MARLAGALSARPWQVSIGLRMAATATPATAAAVAYGLGIKPISMLRSHQQLDVSQSRSYSSANSAARGRLIVTNILDKYIPPKKLPIPLTKRDVQVLWQRFKRFALTNWSVYLLRKSGTGWSVPQFTRDAEKMYIHMNQEFARGNKDGLSRYVGDGLLVTLNPEIKAMKRLGNCVWESHGSAERPRLINMITQKVTMDMNEEHRLTQATVRVNVLQSMSIYKDGKLVGGNPNERKSIVEYIVLERWLDGKWAEKEWKIVGKIQPESEDAGLPARGPSKSAIRDMTKNATA